MKKSFLIFTFLAFFVGLNAQRTGLYSQRQNQGGYLFLSAGPSYLSGDTFGDILKKSMLDGNNWATSFGFRYIFPENFGFSVNLGYANYVGADSNTHHHQDGFYSYVSNIYELTFRGEYTIQFGEKFQLRPPNSVYGFVGIGALGSSVSNPAGVIAVPVIANEIGAVVPVGVGYRYEFRNKLSLGLEASGTMTFSDAVDGYKVKGTANDNLVNFSITIGYKIF